MMNKIKEKEKIITPDKVLSLWNSCDINDIGVFIENPFCGRRCDYCCYFRSLYDEDDYKEYYENYLPKVIDFYEPVLEDKNIVSWFFGGGTPSLIKPDYLIDILEKLPEIKKNGEKTFELHPAHWNEKQLEILDEYNFDNIIIGVQTFNQKVLKKYNREPVGEKEIKKLIKILKNKGFNVCIDIIAFFERGGSMDNFLTDLNIAYTLDVDEVSIYTLRGQKNKYGRRMIHGVLESKLLKSNKYTTMGKASGVDFNKKETVENIFKRYRSQIVVRLAQKEAASEMFSFANYQTPYEYFSYPVIGMGSPRDKKLGSFSKLKVGDENILFSEFTEDFSDFKFKIKYSGSFFGEMDKIIKKIKDLGTPPSELNIKFRNRLTSSGIFKFPLIISSIRNKYSYSPDCQCESCMYIKKVINKLGEDKVVVE